MTGGARNIGPLTAAETATLLVIMVELSMGLFLTEAGGIPDPWLRQILPDEMRARIFPVAILIIVPLAPTGAGLIWLEGIVLAKGTAVGTGGSAVFLPVPHRVRMGLAFCLPFAIALWAVHFEALLKVFRAPRL